jgi:altronate dehydratase
LNVKKEEEVRTLPVERLKRVNKHIQIKKFKGISSTPAAFDLIDITALQTSSSVTETKENLGTL